MNDTARTVRIQLLIAFMCVAMLAYFVLLGRLAIAMIASGRAAAVGLGAGAADHCRSSGCGR